MAINAERDINILYYTETDIREDEGESNYETLPFVSIIENLQHTEPNHIASIVRKFNICDPGAQNQS